jgi:tetratricopeptide (TPR) repeat protein
MKKKPSRNSTRQSAAPQSAQLNAVRKLLRTGRHEEAETRVADLRARYSDFIPLLALAWEIDDNAGNVLSACLHAWDWSTARPGSLAALEALRDSAFEAGLPALAESAARRLAQAEGNHFPDLPPLRGALGELTFDQAVAIDLSRLFLTYGRYDETIAALEGIDRPSARNNLAMARFAQGDVAAALVGFEVNWRQDMRNLFALHYTVRLRLWTGGSRLACELADAFRNTNTQPLRAEDAYGKMFGLLLLGAHDDAIDAWRTLRGADFWNEGNVLENSTCAYFAGLATLRKGDMEAAGKLFSEALDLYPGNLDAEKASMALTFRRLGREVDPKAGEFRDWFPQSWIDEVLTIKGAHAQHVALQAQQRRCDAHEDYLAAAVELGGEDLRFYAMSVLKLRAVDGDAAARDTLRSLLSRPCGPDKVRLDLDIWLQENGLVEAGQPQQLLQHGEVKELALRPMRLHAEQRHLGLPPAEQARLEQMRRLLTQTDDLDGALRIAEALAAAHPEHPTLIANIASVKDMLGHDLDEIETLFQRAATLDPTYLFAQAGLARIAARKGNVECARELLESLQGREEYHFSDWRAILMAEREIALAQRDMAWMLNLDEALDELSKQFG